MVGKYIVNMMRNKIIVNIIATLNKGAGAAAAGAFSLIVSYANPFLRKSTN